MHRFERRWRIPPPNNTPWEFVDYLTRDKMLIQYDVDNAVQGPPSAFTINPDNTVSLNQPPDQVYEWRAEFWRRPIILTNDGDVPLMPSEHHRIIMCRAAVMYGNREDAPEIISGLTAEYIDMLDKLQADQCEGWALRRSSTDREQVFPTQNSLQQWLGS